MCTVQQAVPDVHAQAVNYLISQHDCAFGTYPAGSCHVLAEAAHCRFQQSRRPLWHKEIERREPASGSDGSSSLLKEACSTVR